MPYLYSTGLSEGFFTCRIMFQHFFQSEHKGPTLKKVMVAPSSTAPYSIFVCLAKSSAESMGDSMRSTVRKAARLAVYEEMMISVKNHQMPPTILVERALGISSEPNGNQGRKVKPMHRKQSASIRHFFVTVLRTESLHKKSLSYRLTYCLYKQTQLKWKIGTDYTYKTDLGTVGNKV